MAPDLSREEEIRQLWDGKYKLDILRVELRNYETAQLQVRTAKAQGLRQRNLIITLSAAILGGLGAVFAVAWFASALSGRLRTLAANADRLGEGLPLAPQPRAGDELGQVGQRLAQASELLAARAAEAQPARREAETANRAKTGFLSRSSHELRTPLNAILGYAQVLEMDLPEPGHRRHLQHILGAGRHLLGLITELLDIARIEADQLDLSPEPISVHAAVHEALGLIAPDADKHGIRLQPAAIDGPWTVRAIVPPSNAGSGVCRLLSIEDNPSNQAPIRPLSERRPQWQLLEAASLPQARALLQHGVPDLILLDLPLSDGNGDTAPPGWRQPE